MNEDTVRTTNRVGTWRVDAAAARSLGGQLLNRGVGAGRLLEKHVRQIVPADEKQAVSDMETEIAYGAGCRFPNLGSSQDRAGCRLGNEIV